jgi:hypothetical protein
MKKNIFFVLCLAIFLLLPDLSLAECTDLGGFTNFSLEGADTVVLYSGSRPVASFDVEDCSVESSSKIELIKSYVCDGEEILVDGSRCTIMEIKPLGP